MAITIVTQPGLTPVSSVYRDITFVVTSNAGTIAKMEAAVRIFNSDTVGSGVDDTVTLILDPDLGTTNQFTFDIGKVCRDALRSYYNNEADSFPTLDSFPAGVESNGSLRLVNVVFTELLDSGGLLIDGATDSTPTLWIMNYVLFLTETTTQFLMNTSSPARFLTRAPQLEPILTTENRFLDAVLAQLVNGIADYDMLSYQLAVERFDTSGGSLGTQRVAINPATPSKRFILGAGVVNLQAGGFTFTGAEGSYEVWVEITAGNARISEKKSYKIVDDCRFQQTRFYWVNRYGGMDAFTFTGEKERFYQVDRQEYEKALPAFVNSAAYKQNRGMKVLENVSSVENTSFSALLSASQRGLMEDLFSSHLVMTESSSGGVKFFQPVIVDGEIIQTVNVDFFQIQIRYRQAHKVLSQRG